MKIIVNGVEHILPDGQYLTTYEQLVEIAGESGTPSMAVSFGDRERAGKALGPGDSIGLDDGARVRLAHTGCA